MYRRQFKEKRGRNTHLGQTEWNAMARMVSNLSRSRSPNSHSGSIGNVSRSLSNKILKWGEVKDDWSAATPNAITLYEHEIGEGYTNQNYEIEGVLLFPTDGNFPASPLLAGDIVPYLIFFVGYEGKALILNTTADGSVTAIVTQTPAYNDDDKAKFIVKLAGISEGLWVGVGDNIEISKAFGFEGLADAARDIRNWSPWWEPDCVIMIKKQWMEEINTKTAVGYTHATKTFALENVGLDVEVGDMGHLSGTNITAGQYVVSEVPDDDSLVFAGIVSSDDNADSQVYVGGGMFWFMDMGMRYCGTEEEASIRYNETDKIEQAVWA